MFIRSLIIFFSLCQFAFSHELKPAIANLELTSNSAGIHYELKIQLNLESIISEVDPNHDNTDESKNSERYEQLRRYTPELLRQEYQKIRPFFFQNIHFSNGNNTIVFKDDDINIEEVGDLSLARETEIVLRGNFPSSNSLLQFRWNPFYGSIVLRVNKDREELFTKYLQNGDAAYFSTSANQQQTFLSVVQDYIIIGFQHIVPKGLDHILFVVGLFLLSTRLRPLIWQISAFTLAHTITIFLGVMKIVTIPALIVEPIIAISIVYIAIENIFLKDLSKWRPVLVFIFGLLHGLGFAGILNEIGVAESYFITSLVSFNIGVEIGQLLVISICFVSIGLWFGQKKWYRSYLTNPLSAMIAIVGLFWFIERVGFLI